MIVPAIKIEWRYHNAIRDDVREEMWPLMEVVEELARSIGERVFGHGVAADGKRFSTYAASTRRMKRFRRPEVAAPSGTKNFVQSGQLKDSMRVRAMSPTRIRVSFYGRRDDTRALQARKKGGGRQPARTKRLTNALVAKFVNSPEHLSMLDVSVREQNELAQALAERVPARLLEGLAIRTEAFDRSRRLASLQRRATKAAALAYGARSL